MSIVAPSALRALAAAAALSSCGGTLNPGAAPSTGTLVVRLTNTAFLPDDVRSMEVFVVRVDVRLASAVRKSRGRDTRVDSAGSGGWMTILTPGIRVNLADFQHHVALQLGSASVPAGTYRDFRLVIDPARSSVTLIGGTVLTSTASPPLSFLDSTSANMRVLLPRPVTIVAGATTTVRVDFAVDQCCVRPGVLDAPRGRTLHPVLLGTVEPRRSSRMD